MESAYLIPLKQEVKVKKVFDNYYKAYNENGYIGTFFVDNIVFNQIHQFVVNVLDFNDRGQAFVPEQEFMSYLEKTAECDDYTKRVRRECQVEDKNWVVCECINYYNRGGCLLASYNLDFNYGELI